MRPCRPGLLLRTLPSVQPASAPHSDVPSSVDDAAAVDAMLGRPARAAVTVAVRCHLGLPVVASTPPLLDDGTPFPTTFWLTCPLAVRRISRLESSGIIRRIAEVYDTSPADADYAQRRDSALDAMRAEGLVSDDAPVPSGGVGGSAGGVKCLHARYAFFAVGGDDPAGAETAARIGALDCSAPCVRTDGTVQISRGATDSGTDDSGPGDLGPVDVTSPVPVASDAVARGALR